MIDRNTYTAMTDPIETASRDEIEALQLHRLKNTLAHAYDNVAHYKKAFDKYTGVVKDAIELSKSEAAPGSSGRRFDENRMPSLFIRGLQEKANDLGSVRKTGKVVIELPPRSEYEWKELFSDRLGKRRLGRPACAPREEEQQSKQDDCPAASLPGRHDFSPCIKYSWKRGATLPAPHSSTDRK